MAAKSFNKFEQDLESLRATVATATALISQLQDPSAPTGHTQSELNALNLAHDAASLIRAHATKLSLLIINKPFTASAIATVLRELVSGPLPGLASAVELCDGRYTKAMSEELTYHAASVFTEVGILINAIPLDGNILSDDAKNGTGSTAGKGSLAMTGTVWQACDAVIELKKIGIAGLAVRKAEQYKATLKDALEELQEWAEEESDGEDGDVGSADEDDAQRAVDEMFGSQKHISADDPEKLRPRLDGSLKRLRLLILMYQAVVKRRLKTLPAFPLADLAIETGRSDGADKSTEESKEHGESKGASVVHRVDKAVELMKELPDIVDELANAFYELDKEEIDERMIQCFTAGAEAVESLKKNWEGKEDEFTLWAQKFQKALVWHEGDVKPGHPRRKSHDFQNWNLQHRTDAVRGNALAESLKGTTDEFFHDWYLTFSAFGYWRHRGQFNSTTRRDPRHSWTRLTIHTSLVTHPTAPVDANRFIRAAAGLFIPQL
ncbi:conserved fungal protein [Drepanopeziza brunnea f. sp. 'multigermtubi' MB_m1]|uniref:Conserved fungal protein n=1 Tax=Marssonina brunnea f. sp. multigermtubi (strain MB_m1) TaxID=1072389 RepID=K1X908_MARBU|nr:uncharacterized protein MBM_04775 [Drepanopeziza brunnea f. sp. 'multigermtubi' MB_m1]EKD17198.1 conserved fungal protein [Drepanopeziza brunnea f. sp. 'multigermtubi' MB_m1]